MADDYLEERVRAEDILLGALGFDSDASIVEIRELGDGYTGKGRWSDGEEFDFSSEEELDDIERWALTILLKTNNA